METGYITVAERIADSFAVGLDMKHLSRTQVMILHAIKSIAVRQWAIETLRREKGITL